MYAQGRLRRTRLAEELLSAARLDQMGLDRIERVDDMKSTQWVPHHPVCESTPAIRREGEIVTPELFPLFLCLEKRRVLVVGGGAIAAHRVEQLSRAGARVAVVAPEIRPEILTFAREVHRRPFSENDLDGAFLAVAAATSVVNERVVQAAEARAILVNAVDGVAAATAYCGGLVRRGGVVIAVSTEGRAPALSGLLREALEALLPDDLASWTAEAERLRTAWKQEPPPIQERRPLLLQALNALYASRSATSSQREPGSGFGDDP